MLVFREWIKTIQVFREPIGKKILMLTIQCVEALGHWDEEDEIPMLDKNYDKENKMLEIRQVAIHLRPSK